NSSTDACTRPWMTALVQAILCELCSIPAPLRLRIEAHFRDLILARALAGLEGDGVSGLPPDQGPGQRRRDGDAALLDVGLEVTNDAVGDLVAAVGVGQLDGGPEHHPRARQLARIDHLGLGQDRLDLTRAPLDEGLLLLGRVELGVLAEIAV